MLRVLPITLRNLNYIRVETDLLQNRFYLGGKTATSLLISFSSNVPRQIARTFCVASEIVGTLRSNDADDNENVKKKPIGLISKTTILFCVPQSVKTRETNPTRQGPPLDENRVQDPMTRTTMRTSKK